jgi:hypothetical protein
LKHEELNKALWKKRKARIRQRLEDSIVSGKRNDSTHNTARARAHRNRKRSLLLKLEFSVKIDVEEFEELIHLAFLRKTKREEV